MGRREKKTKTVAKKIERAIRFGIVGAAIILSVWIAFSCVKKTVRPFNLYFIEARETKHIDNDIKKLKTENASLRNKANYLKTKEGAETEARQLGWVRKGEIALVVEKQSKEKEKK